MVVLLFLLILIALLVSFYRRRNTSGKIIFKLILAICSLALTLSLLAAALESRDSYYYSLERESLKGRLESIESYYNDMSYASMAWMLLQDMDVEPEFDKYWECIREAEEKNTKMLLEYTPEEETAQGETAETP